MSGRMNWWRSSKSAKPSIDIRDERENEDAGRDRASKWLKQREAQLAKVEAEKQRRGKSSR